MRPASRILDKVLTGHLCTVTAPITGRCANRTLTEGLPTAALGSRIVPHTIKRGSKCKPHVKQTTKTTTSNVFVQGRPITKMIDPADKGIVIKGAKKVISN